VLDFSGRVFVDDFVRSGVSNANDHVVSVGIDDELGVSWVELTCRNRRWVTLADVAARARAWLDGTH
jgi:hypothetical protein